MERRFVLAVALSLLVMLGYPYLLKKFYPAAAPKPAAQRAQEAPVPPAPVPAPPLAGEIKRAAIGEKKFNYEDESFKVTFTNLGGGISELSLTKYQNERQHGGNVLIQKTNANPAGMAVRVFEGGIWDEGVYSLETKDRLYVSLVKEQAGRYRIRKAFRFVPDQYTILVDVTVENLSQESFALQYEIVSPLFIGDTPQQDRITLEADYYGHEMDVRNTDKILKNGYHKDGPLEWVGLEKKYFAVIAKPEAGVDYVRSAVEDNSVLHFIKPEDETIAPAGSKTHRYVFYAGPKNYEVLKAPEMDFEKILHTKILGGLWIYFLIGLKFFYKLFHNYGVAIIVFSSLIKLAFAPLTHMSFESMRKMQALQPKMKALQEQYKNDPQKLNQEVMELYKKNKVNPFGGCLPLLLQMPIFVALYQTFSQAIELRGAPFFAWITDLSEPDQIFLLPFSLPLIANKINVLPILMIGTMVWQQKCTPQTAATKEQEMIMLLTPVIFGFIFYNLPSGLVLYWIVNNILTIAHQLAMKRFHAQPAH